MHADVAAAFERLVDVNRATNRRLDEVIAQVTQLVVTIGTNFTAVNQRLDTLAGRIDTLGGRIDSLSGRIDRLLESVAETRQQLVEHSHHEPH
jgi:hypothetical protein